MDTCTMETPTMIESESSLSQNSLNLLQIVIDNKKEDNNDRENKNKKINIGARKHIHEVENYTSRDIARSAQKQRVYRNLQLAKHIEYATVVCYESGMVSLMEIPAIPGYALICNHPISELPNARGLAQQGKDYLRKLDMQIVAGILIILANDYSLFRYQPSDSGAQKNAILRTVQKDILINAILTIEDMIHSGNHYYIPKLSLILEGEILQGGIENRMKEWLKLVIEAIYKPDTEIYDANETVQRKQNEHNKEQKKLRILREKNIRKEEKTIKDECKTATGLIKDLFKMQLISLKLKNFLDCAFQEFQLITMDSAARCLLSNKLSDMPEMEAAQLITILNKKRIGLIAKNTPMEDFFTEHSVQTPKNVLSRPKTPEQTFSNVEIPLEPVAEGMLRVTISGKSFIVQENEYVALSFIERVKYNKALMASPTMTGENNGNL